MAKKKGFIGTVLTLSAVAAAAAAVYYKRDEIRELLEEAKERFSFEEELMDEEDVAEDGEGDIIIDITVEREPQEEEEGTDED